MLKNVPRDKIIVIDSDLFNNKIIYIIICIYIYNNIGKLRKKNIYIQILKYILSFFHYIKNTIFNYFIF